MKPDNVMIDHMGHIKLIDFGFAKIMDKRDQRAYTNCGTLGYTAPEVLKGHGYSYPADVWSFGIMLIVLLTGTLPFTNLNDPMEINEQIIQGDINYSRENLDSVTKDLL